MSIPSVVIVDDDLLNREILTAFLKRFGYHPTDFPSAEALLKTYRHSKRTCFCWMHACRECLGMICADTSKPTHSLNTFQS